VKSALVVVGLEINGVSDQATLRRLDDLAWFVNELVAFGCRQHQSEGLQPFDKTFFVVGLHDPRYSSCLRRDRLHQETYVKMMNQPFLSSVLGRWEDSYREELKELGNRLRSDGIEQVAVCGSPTLEAISELKRASFEVFLISDEQAFGFTEEEGRNRLLATARAEGTPSTTKSDIFETWCHKTD